jgi:rhodanese-related sulfurtransferase
MIMKILLFFLAFFLLAESSSSYAQQRKTKYIPVSVEKADKILAKKRMVILDVRTPEEVAQGFVPGAIFHNFNSPGFKNSLSNLPKNKPYFVYCRSGKRSGKAVEMMKEMGFKKVYEMNAGFPAYQAFKNKPPLQ